MSAINFSRKGRPDMSGKHVKLIEKAKRKFGSIYPCCHTQRWIDCFSVYNGKLYFWFNADDHSTHVVMDETSVNLPQCSVA